MKAIPTVRNALHATTSNASKRPGRCQRPRYPAFVAFIGKKHEPTGSVREYRGAASAAFEAERYAAADTGRLRLRNCRAC